MKDSRIHSFIHSFARSHSPCRGNSKGDWIFFNCQLSSRSFAVVLALVAAACYLLLHRIRPTELKRRLRKSMHRAARNQGQMGLFMAPAGPLTWRSWGGRTLLARRQEGANHRRYIGQHCAALQLSAIACSLASAMNDAWMRLEGLYLERSACPAIALIKVESFEPPERAGGLEIDDNRTAQNDSGTSPRLSHPLPIDLAVQVHLVCLSVQFAVKISAI